MTITRPCFYIVFPVLFGVLYASGCKPAADSAGGDEGRIGEIDLIVEGDWVVTMDAGRRIIEGGAVAVDQGVILAVGTTAEIRAAYTARDTLPGAARVVLPGLVNGHSHAAMTLLRGVADDLALMDWLENYIFPAEVEFVDPEFVRIGTELACWEMIRGGTTTFVDMYYHPDTIAEVVERCGMRALISATVIGQRSPDAEGAADSIDKGIGFIERWQGRNPRITPIFGPHANYTLDAEQLKATRRAALEYGVPISIHMAESPYEAPVLRRHVWDVEHRDVRVNRLLRGTDDRCARRLADRGRDPDPRAPQGRRHPQPDLEHEDRLRHLARRGDAGGRRSRRAWHRRRGEQQRPRPVGGDAARRIPAESGSYGPPCAARDHRAVDGDRRRRARDRARRPRSARWNPANRRT